MNAARPEVGVRDVEPGDAEAVAALLGELGYPVGATELVGRLDAVARDPTSRLFVAVDAGLVVGLAGLHLTVVPHRAAPVGRCTVLVVRADRRGRGIGRALLRHVEQRARAAGCARIEVTSNRRRTDAHAFYAAAGYDPSSLRFVKDLEATEPPDAAST